MKYRHVVWDWNGTLLMDDDVSVRVMNGMLARRGLPPLSLERYKKIIDFPIQGYYALLGFDFDREPYEELTVEFISGYEAAWRECTLAPEAMRLVQAIRRAGLTQSVLSANRGERLEEQVRFFGLEGFFDPLTGLDDDYAHDKTFLAVDHLAAIGLPPERVIYVGDTLHDAETAEAMGCPCALVSWGHVDRERLAATGHPVADDAAELLDILGIAPAGDLG